MSKDGVGLGLEITELRLGLPGGNSEKNEKKRVFSEIVTCGELSKGVMNGDDNKSDHERLKNQVVGWPPVCSYRKKINNVMYVKVSMDGAPFLRKIDLSIYKDYIELAMALEKLFGCIGIVEALNDADNSEYVPIYEDKDGDWMLVGDVPWGMFSESCKRLRMMKRSEETVKGVGLRVRDFLKDLAKTVDQ
ncbi:auxin-induced protein IAA6-like [Impatiens glandulifera]|uniref:auxin-induced protein IAA6-like n=1 Tax=Impatiens glandulifera TaxID=253017 RepID=UPI001FB13ABA|nr:auxin-induced protein IAA6-like [Impatiens glandulifera]